MKKLITIFLLAGLVFSASIQKAEAGNEPRSYVVNATQNGSSTSEYYNVFFDYEAGVWHGAPVAVAHDISKWKDIDAGAYTLKLDNGDELVTLNNLPAIKNGNGVKEIR